ncbi:MAG: DUF6268 family outer membrane beta-barrel protein [Bacteroidota bacterium]
MKVLISLLLIFSSIAVTAQNSLDILTISGRFGLASPYTDTYPGKATETGGFIELNAPVPLNKDRTLIWYNSLFYSQSRVNNSEPIGAGVVDPINLHAFILRTGLMKVFNNGSALQLLLGPRLMSDFININSKNWQMGVFALYEKKYSETLLMRFGFMLHNEMYGPNLVPLVYLNWKLADQWSITGTLPISAKINYHVNDNLTVGFSHFGLGTTFRLGDERYLDDYIERNSIDLQLFLRKRIAGNLFFEGRFGHTLNRQYKQYEEDQKLGLRLVILNFGDDRIIKNEVFKNGLLATARIVYNLPLPD